MKAGIAQSGRTILAAITAALMVLSVMFVFASPADADHVDTWPATPESNDPGFWETWGEQNEGEDDWSCSKTDNPNDTGTPYELGDPPSGEYWRLLVVKAGNDHNDLYWDPIPGEEYAATGQGAGGWSHVILCSRPLPELGEIVVVKEVTEGSDTNVAFTFEATGFTLDDNTLAHGESGSSGDLEAGNYAVSETVPTGWTLESATCDNGDTPDSIDLAAGDTVTCTFVNDETPPPPPESGEIVVQKVVTGEASQTFEFTFNTTGFTLGDNMLAHGQSSSSGDIAAGDGYSVSEDVPTGWTQVSAVCDDGSDPSNIDVAAGETVTCTFTNTIVAEVQASIVVTVDGVCEVDGDEGQGIIDVEISVDGGADVVISDSDGDVIETLTSSGTVTVPEGATYTWEATPNEGFEFPEGSDTSGSITIETCSDDPETLPFTGLDTGMMSVLASALLGGGLLLVNAMRRQEEA